MFLRSLFFLFLSIAGFISERAVAGTRSSEAIAAFQFLKKNLTAELQFGTFSSDFRSVNDDICHVKARENLGLYGLMEFDLNMSDLDVNSLEIKGQPEVRALNAASVPGHNFNVSVFNGETKQWSVSKPSEAVAFVTSGGNENSILRALAVLAKDCGAPQGF
jgi:hypothetical protein